jgi:hypothetical protein
MCFHWRAGHEVYGIFSHGRVFAFLQRPAGFIAQSPRLSQRYGRIFAQRKDLFFAVIRYRHRQSFPPLGDTSSASPSPSATRYSAALGFRFLIFNSVNGMAIPEFIYANLYAFILDCKKRCWTGLCYKPFIYSDFMGVSGLYRTGQNKKMAETRGFEPPVRFNPYNKLATCRLQPLGHVSVYISSIAEGLLRSHLINRKH